MKMKIVLKPGGVFLVIGILAMLTVMIMSRLRPSPLPAVSVLPTVSASPIANAVRLGEVRTVAEPKAGSLTTRRETLPGSAEMVTVYAVETLKKVANPWDVNTNVVVSDPLPANAPLRLVFWARSKHSGDIGANHEETEPPFAKSLTQTLATTPEWKEFNLPFHTDRAYEAGKSQLAFHCGYEPGTIEIADIRLLRDEP